MNGYSFSKNGKHFCTCWGAKYAAEQIAETASLQSMHPQSVNEWYVGKENGIEAASGADFLAYANGFTLDAIVKSGDSWDRVSVTADNLHIFPKVLRDSLRRYWCIDGEWWIYGKPSSAILPKEKTFSVKAEYADRWTEDATYPLIVTESEISRLAAEWGVSFCELLDQVDEIDND